MSAHSIVDDIEDAGEKVSWIARAVAAKRGTIVAVIGTAGTVAAALGLPDALGVSQYATTWVERGIAVASVIGGITWIHKGATTADASNLPKDTSGELLVPLSEAAQHIANATTGALVDVQYPGLIDVDPDEPEDAELPATPAPGPDDRAVDGAFAATPNPATAALTT
ncbi:hypothetical protein ACSMXN_09215 [Jatrophihabitans sp. DSM 45814]